MPELVGAMPDGITIDRLKSRRTLLEQIDDQVRSLEGGPSLDHFGKHKQQAYDLLTSSTLKAAFELHGEDARLIDRYGRTLFGHSTLIARRLVERGRASWPQAPLGQREPSRSQVGTAGY